MSNRNTKVEITDESPAFAKLAVSCGFSVVKQNHVFTFKKLCPYCDQNLSYEADAWEQDGQGLWMATNFDCRCHSEPDIDSEDWDEWMRVHTDMPYVFQLPVDEKVKEYIQKHYRFWMSDENHS